jgi:protein O-GlcNAc transferase
MLDRDIERGIALQNKGDWIGSVKAFDKSLRVNQKNAIALYSLAVSYFNLKDYKKAFKYIDLTISLNKIFAPSYLLRSYLHFENGDISYARADAEKAKELDSTNEQVLAQLSKINLAESSGMQSPKVQMHLLAGVAFQGSGKNAEAFKEFEEVLKIDPENYNAHYSLGVLNYQLGQLDEAIKSLKSAVNINSAANLAYFALATIYQQLKLYDLAIEAFDGAIKANPSSLDAYNNKAVLLHDMHRHLQALETLDQGLTHSPLDLKTLSNKAYILTEFKQHVTASSIFRSILAIEPERDYVLGLYAYSMLHSCNWSDYQENVEKLAINITENKKTINPLAYMGFSADVVSHKKCAEIFGLDRFPAAGLQLCSFNDRYVHQKKRVAFLSSDFREHPVGYLFIGLLEKLDRSRIETYGLSLCHNDGSELYKRFKGTFDNYLTCEDKSSSEIARVVKQQEIDVLIDLSGYTSGARLDLLAMRPAPVQVTYLGFPGTLGLDYVDYIIADQGTIPLENTVHFSEKVLRLSSCYLPRDLTVLPADQFPSKVDFNLPVDAFVFCSFNHEYKITPKIFKIWMELLHEIPGSVLWLMRLSEDSQKSLVASAQKFGIESNRLIFAKRVPRSQDHLARYRHVDLCLDTFPYNGHTTTSDALFSGVPVVTLAGSSFASRVATSLLQDLSLADELSCNSFEAYKACAKSLAADPDRLGKIRNQLHKHDIHFWNMNAQRQAQEFTELICQISSDSQK